MGRKEWLYWGGGSGGAAGKSRKGSTTTANHPSSSSSSSSSGGCMSAIFQLFDLHQFQFQQNPFMPSDPNLLSNITPGEELPNTHIVLKGVEAPRNSLEMEELASSSSSSPSSSPPPVIKLDIPMGIKIKTGRSRLLTSSDECNSSLSCSPGTKTPSLVARLMGLDLLPDQISSPRPSASSNYSTTTPNLKSSSSSSHHHSHSRSLPETPRLSTASGRRSTDTTDYHHRLSLQIPDKENHYHTFTSPTTTTRRGGGEETSHYAKQILKQVRENVSMRRSVGADITNTVITNRKKEQRRDENLVVLLKSKKPSSSSSSVDDHINHQSTPLSCSPRLRFLENKNKLTSVPSSNINISAPLSIINEVKGPSPKVPKSQPPLMAKEKPMQKQQKLQEEDKVVKRCKKIASERYDVRVKKLHLYQHQQKKKQEEPFVKLTFADKKSKKPSSRTTTPPLVPNNLFSINNTKFLSFKKNPSQKQVPHESITQSPRSQSRSYSSKATPTLSVGDDHDSRHGNDFNLKASAATTTTAAAAAAAAVPFEYISRILNYKGIDKNTSISTAHWHSPSHPLNPSIFHHLELSHTVTQRSDRKLIFELANEILVDILKPYIDFRPWLRCESRKLSNGHQLFDEMCKRVTSFPAADCKVLEDIDAVIDTDLSRGSTREQRKIAFEEEAERIIMEIEGDIVEKLVHETLMW